MEVVMKPIAIGTDDLKKYEKVIVYLLIKLYLLKN